MADEGVGSKEVVIATYREIAQHFGLTSGPDAGRLKARRAGWPTGPRNHPADPVRVHVPKGVWEAANPFHQGAVNPSPRRAGSSPPAAAAEPQGMKGGRSLVAERLRAARLEVEVQALRDALTHERQQVGQEREARLEAEAARAEADARAGAAISDSMALRERLGRAEAEREAAREAARAAQEAAQAARQELEGWLAGGPLRRALRGLLTRR